MKLKKFNFKTINSTNNLAIKIIKNSNNKSGIVIAEKQKKGKGQHGKKWASYKGNLLVSIFFEIDRFNFSLKKLTKINCLLVKKILTLYYKKNIEIKKPNDLLINKKKISGILQEIYTKSNQSFIIIGIGINIVKSPYIKNYPTTNLFDLTNIYIDKNKVIKNLIKIYEKFIPKISKISLINMKKI